MLGAEQGFNGGGGVGSKPNRLWQGKRKRKKRRKTIVEGIMTSQDGPAHEKKPRPTASLAFDG